MSLVDLLRNLATSSENTDLAQRAYGRAEAQSGLTVGTPGAPAFQNGWGSSTGITFWRDRWGRVRLEGKATRADLARSQLPIFSLPVGYRPALPITLVSNAFKDHTNSLGQYLSIHIVIAIGIGTDGLMFVETYATGFDEFDLRYVSLTGLDFPV